MKLFSTDTLQVFARITPKMSLITPKLTPKVKSWKLGPEEIQQVQKLRPTHSVKALAKKFNCSPLAISMYSPKLEYPKHLIDQETQWNSFSRNRQLTAIRRYQRRALW